MASLLYIDVQVLILRGIAFSLGVRQNSLRCIFLVYN